MSHVQSSSRIEQKIAVFKGGDALFNNDGDVIMTTTRIWSRSQDA